MEYKKIERDSYNIHLIKTNRFKSMTIRVCLKSEVKKEEITLRNALTSFLCYTTDTYPTKRDMVLHSQDLYVANIYSKNYRSGRFDLTNFYLTILNEKYTEKGMLEESIKFLNDVIFNPNFTKNEKDDAFKYLYKSGRTSLLGIKENPSYYSLIRMMELLGNDEPYTYREVGYIEDLDKIDINELEKYYEKFIKNVKADIYVIGDYDEENIISLIDRYLAFNNNYKLDINPIYTHDSFGEEKIIKEEIDSNQSKLTIGCKIEKLEEFDLNYTLTLYNMILGGSTESKFFQIIREKNSLAYYCSSSLYKLDHLMIIRAGIDRENFDKTVSLVKELMQEMIDGKFTEHDIEISKTEYISRLKEIEDSETSIIETYIAKDLLNLGDIDERIEKIKKVTKEDIINVAKKVKLDTIFLLEGVLSDEGN